jgi:hypothetical protein
LGSAKWRKGFVYLGVDMGMSIIKFLVCVLVSGTGVLNTPHLEISWGIGVFLFFISPFGGNV